MKARRCSRLGAAWLACGLGVLLTACASTPSPTPVVVAATTLAPTLITPSPPPATATFEPPPSPVPTFTPSPSSSPTSAPTHAPSPTPFPTTTSIPTQTATAAPTATPTFQTQASQFLTKAVVLIIIDGARWSETFGDPGREFIPHLAQNLAPLGAINTAFYNDGATLSVPGHAAIVTGTWQDIPNDGRVRPTAPTIFEYYWAAAGADEDKAVFVHGSFIEPVLTYSTHPDYGASFGARMFFSDYPTPPYDDGMWANARRTLTELYPNLLMISLLDPDEAAHQGQWDAYRQAIRHDDEIIWDLWQQLQNDPFYAGQTTLIVTNDHGRGCGEGWANHGGADECNRHVMFLIVGPDIQPGLVIQQRRTLRDIAPTIGHLLAFHTPLTDGEVMTELFIP